MRHTVLLASWLAALLVGCAGSESPPAIGGGTTGASLTDTAISSSTPPATSSTSLSPTRRAELEQAAKDVVRFLVGEAKLDLLTLADTVELHLPAEGAGTSAGTSVRLAREALGDPNAWRIRAGDRSFSFVPPKGLTRTTARAGAHFICRETPLASRAPALASRPHVGVLLEPSESQSCLQSWNATFVFDTSATTPRLVAALYDQWEW